MKRIVVLGATGSIGTQTLDVVRLHPELQVVGLVAGSREAELRSLSLDFPEAKLALMSPQPGQQTELPSGVPAVIDLVESTEVDCVVVSVAGVIGLVPTLKAIEAKKQIALASKEVLVAGGELVMQRVKENGVLMTPIDSEHSAVFQCLQGAPQKSVAQIVLTASGGPFRGKRKSELEAVSVQDALNHPTWNMGGKITIDSATLMNKALEMIEAKWLFDVPMSAVELTVHPQSIVHSMVKFTDGSVIGQMGWPNMRLPIQYALLYPERPPSGLADWNPADSGTLTFEPPDLETFRGPTLARHAEAAGGTMPCVMNAANEELVAAFLAGKISFLTITDAVERVMESHTPEPVTLETLLATDQWARERAKEIAGYE